MRGLGKQWNVIQVKPKYRKEKQAIVHISRLYKVKESLSQLLVKLVLFIGNEGGNKEKYVFSQFISFLNEDKFRRIVDKYHGNRYVKHFTCWNQLLTLMFGQLSNRESLRDLIVALEAHHSKCYHLGMGKKHIKVIVSKSKSRQRLSYFEEYAYYLVSETRQKRVNHIFKLGGNVYAFDSTTINLCLSVFQWAKFRKKKGDIKVHTLYDVETQIPAFFHITEASVHDSKTMIDNPYESGSYYIFDHGYNNFKMLCKIHQIEAYFVAKAKKNLQYKSIKWKRRLPKNVLSSASVLLVGFYPK